MDTNPFGQYEQQGSRPFNPNDWFLSLSEGPLSKRQKEVAEILKSHGIKNILDYGAGFGAFILELLRKESFANYVGVDADPEAFNQTSELAERLTNQALKRTPDQSSPVNLGAQNILAKLMRRKFQKSREEKISEAKFQNNPRDLIKNVDSSLHFNYGKDEKPHSITFIQAILPLDDDTELLNLFSVQPNNWALTAIGVTENLLPDELPKFFNGLNQILEHITTELIVMSYLEQQKQNTFGGVIQKTMAQIGPSIFNAKPPKLNAHKDFIEQCQSYLPNYAWESVASVGARCYALGRRIEDGQEINTNL